MSGSLQLLDLREVMARTRLGRATIYRWMDRGEFPRPIKLGETINRWLEADLEAWIRSRAERTII